MAPARGAATAMAMPILLAISASHLLNDVMQSLLPAIYPILKTNYALDFGQIGLITLAFQLTASMLQPLVGLYTDRRPLPYSLPFGMLATLCGLVVLGYAGHFWSLLVAASLVGIGSSVFHPEASRVSRHASGGRFGLAQSIFQVGGNAGQALGPLLAAFIVIPFGQVSVSWFAVVALTGIVILGFVSRWYASRLAPRTAATAAIVPVLSRGRTIWTLSLLVTLLFSKFFYVASINTYYTFYTIHTFGVSVQTSQILLFLFLAAFAVGVMAGGPIGDRIGRKRVIWFSILGVLPFTLALPYVGLVGTAVLTVIIGLILASASSAILVYAQELLPGRSV